MRRKVTPALMAVVVGAALAACGSPSTGSGGGGGDGATIKIALIPPKSGALAQVGGDAVKGWQLAVEEANAQGGIDGHKIELIEKETDGQPATTLRVAREAVTKDGAKFISAVVTSPENAALNAQLAGLDALSLISLAKDDALTGKQCAANSFHLVPTTSMDINALAESIDKMPGDKWAIQAVDFATGHSAAEKFAAAAKQAGKEIVLTQFAPLNTTDFGPYITKIKSSGADALFAVEFGADGVAFVKQATQFKLPDQLKTVLGLAMINEALFPALGDAVVGYYNNVGYKVDADNELNQKFTKAYTAKFGTAPYFVPADSYLAAQTLFAGIRAARSIEPAAVAKALNDLTFDSIVGRVTLRGADHQLLRDSYLGRVVKNGKDLKFEILASATADRTAPEPSKDCKL
ncbi:ABC transporter substrate-binding protein [Actinokineospora sp.]|uniref:ABC transporter substrate-binding protein n=1 Tax=Actinokineospora sp. TaxID=1872133 RepID=UPI0040381814